MNKYEIIKEAKLPEEKIDGRLNPNSPQNIARQNGIVHYQGDICKRGHSGLRYTKGGQCIECIGLARNTSIRPKQRSIKNHELSLKAASLGHTTYIPEKPCKYGHLLRYVNSNNCVECDKFQLEKHKINAKYARIKKEYGLSKNEYLQLVHDQWSCCKLCNKHIPDHFKLHVDHCHDTNKVRGLLCGKCNQGIGLLNHDIELLRKAALYCEVTND